MKFQGYTHKYGSNIDTDAIIPARYLNTTDSRELGRHCLEGLDPQFPKKVHQGDLLVAEENFGCGSSREHAPIALKAAGISCIIAKSFARIFYRNAINIGLPILESADAVDGINDADQVKVNTETGEITNLSTGKTFHASPFPEFIRQIIAAGGLIEYVREKVRSPKS